MGSDYNLQNLGTALNHATCMHNCRIYHKGRSQGQTLKLFNMSDCRFLAQRGTVKSGLALRMPTGVISGGLIILINHWEEPRLKVISNTWGFLVSKMAKRPFPT